MFRVQKAQNSKSEEGHDGMMGAKIPPNETSSPVITSPTSHVNSMSF